MPPAPSMSRRAGELVVGLHCDSVEVADVFGVVPNYVYSAARRYRSRRQIRATIQRTTTTAAARVPHLVHNIAAAVRVQRLGGRVDEHTQLQLDYNRAADELRLHRLTIERLETELDHQRNVSNSLVGALEQQRHINRRLDAELRQQQSPHYLWFNNIVDADIHALALKDAFRNATGRLDLCTFVWTDDGFFGAVRDRAQDTTRDRIPIRVMLDSREAAPGKHSKVLELERLGVEVFVRNGYNDAGSMHLKFYVVNDVVYVGSLNLSARAHMKSLEVLAVDPSKQSADEFSQTFTRMTRSSCERVVGEKLRRMVHDVLIHEASTTVNRRSRTSAENAAAAVIYDELQRGRRSMNHQQQQQQQYSSHSIPLLQRPQQMISQVQVIEPVLYTRPQQQPTQRANVGAVLPVLWTLLPEVIARRR